MPCLWKADRLCVALNWSKFDLAEGKFAWRIAGREGKMSAFTFLPYHPGSHRVCVSVSGVSVQVCEEG